MTGHTISLGWNLENHGIGNRNQHIENTRNTRSDRRIDKLYKNKERQIHKKIFS